MDETLTCISQKKVEDFFPLKILKYSKIGSVPQKKAVAYMFPEKTYLHHWIQWSVIVHLIIENVNSGKFLAVFQSISELTKKN